MADEERLLGHAVQVVNDVQVGLLTIVDAEGRPRSRWMAAAAQRGLASVITLTTAGTEKIKHLSRNDRVCWVFARPDFSDVVTLYGRAAIQANPVAAAGAWDHLMEAVRIYAVGPLSGNDDLALMLIETTVESGDLISPTLDLYTPHLLRILGAESR